MDLWDQRVAPVLASRGLSVTELVPFAIACIRRVWGRNKESVSRRAASGCVSIIEEAILSVQNCANNKTSNHLRDGLAADVDGFVPEEDSVEETIPSYNYTVLSVRYLVEAIAEDDPLLVFEAVRAAYEAIVGDEVAEQMNAKGGALTESEAVAIERGMQKCEDEIVFQLTELDKL